MFDSKKIDESLNPENENIREDICIIPPRTGFRNIVRRIQLAARFSNLNHEDECYDEDTKLNTFNNWRRSKRVKSTLSTRRSDHLKKNSFAVIACDPNDNLFAEAKETTPKYMKGEINFLKEECKSEVSIVLLHTKPG